MLSKTAPLAAVATANRGRKRPRSAGLANSDVGILHFPTVLDVVLSLQNRAHSKIRCLSSALDSPSRQQDHLPQVPTRFYTWLMFDDLLEANRRYRSEFHDSLIEGTAARGLAVLTCIDSRIDPLALLGLRAGDAKILRNAGARVTSDALRSLILATNLLGVTRVCIVQHTDCAIAGTTDDELRKRIGAVRGVDVTGWEFLACSDQLTALRQDIRALEACPLVPPNLVVGGFIFDVHTGELVPAI